MSKTGRPRKPDALKRFEGTYRKDRATPNALELPAGVPECPKGLPAAARKLWLELVGDEKWRIVLATVDATGLELLVKHMALERKYARDAARKPMVETPFGPKANPAAKEARNEAAVVKQLLGEFGLTPSARSRVAKPVGGTPGTGGAATTAGTPLVGPGLAVIEGGKASG